VAVDSVTFKTIGRISDFEVIASNDPYWTENTKGRPLQAETGELPLGLDEQSLNYKLYRYAIQLGYKAYFDFKVEGNQGQTTTDVKLVPKFYYVSKTNKNDTCEIDLYYRPSGSGKYTKLDINQMFLMASQIGNKYKSAWRFTEELNKTTNLFKEKSKMVYFGQSISQNKDNPNVLLLKSDINRLIHVTAIEEAIKNHKFDANSENKDPIGHFYGSFGLPTSTVAVKAGTTNVGTNTQFLKNGYAVVYFEEICTLCDDGNGNSMEYLDYGKGDPSWATGTKASKAKFPDNTSVPGTDSSPASVPNRSSIVYDLDKRALDDTALSQ
jgi:hypothetical protein